MKTKVQNKSVLCTVIIYHRSLNSFLRVLHPYDDIHFHHKYMGHVVFAVDSLSKLHFKWISVTAVQSINHAAGDAPYVSLKKRIVGA